MNEKLLKASDYGDRENRAVLQVLVELAQILNSQNKNFVLVGGSVPSLLFNDTTPEHIGTLDIDLNLNPEALGVYDYAELFSLESVLSFSPLYNVSPNLDILACRVLLAVNNPGYDSASCLMVYNKCNKIKLLHDINTKTNIVI